MISNSPSDYSFLKLLLQKNKTLLLLTYMAKKTKMSEKEVTQIIIESIFKSPDISINN